jgi:hypothetical protein
MLQAQRKRKEGNSASMAPQLIDDNAKLVRNKLSDQNHYACHRAYPLKSSDERLRIYLCNYSLIMFSKMALLDEAEAFWADWACCY